MPVVGTAGHVDHGKSTLVMALTGRDPDRLTEEKARGLTIDLGFAWTDLGTMSEVGFVDVPGHERFVKNMLAGVGALDVVLFVVGADSGWMPQSEEHMAVIDLLGVGSGVVALTRIDLTDPDVVDLAQLDVEENVAGTALEGWPVGRVSPVTGEGMEELIAALQAALKRAGPPRDLGRPRLWIDRSFVVAGAGVVVTGTLIDGSIAADDRVEIYPSSTVVRVRGVQSHEQPRPVVGPGNRGALNLAGIDWADAVRGSMLGAPGEWVSSDRLLVAIRPIRRLDDPPPDPGAYHLHMGTAAVPVRLRLLGGGALTGPGHASVHLESALPVAMGDHFILRETGRRAVVAGGLVLDPLLRKRPTSQVARDLEAVIEADRDTRAAALVEAHGRIPTSALAAASSGGRPSAAVVAGGETLSQSTADSLGRSMVAEIETFHDTHPLREGIPKRRLVSRLGADPAIVDALLERAEAVLVDDGATVRLSSFNPSFGLSETTAGHEARSTVAASLAVPRASQLGLDEELLHAIVRGGDLIRVADDLVYLPTQLNEITARIAELPDGFTVSIFREHFGLTRRQAVPLLEWLDAAGWTARRGDGRTVTRQIS